MTEVVNVSAGSNANIVGNYQGLKFSSAVTVGGEVLPNVPGASTGSWVVLKNQVGLQQNGIWFVDQVGTAGPTGLKWSLSRKGQANNLKLGDCVLNRNNATTPLQFLTVSTTPDWQSNFVVGVSNMSFTVLGNLS